MTSMKHGHFKDGKKSPTYSSWSHMISRCYNTHDISYPNYGGRGIRVCDRWRGENGFIHFLADMGERPDNTSIDRIDSLKDYAPDNCRWSNRQEQNANRRKQYKARSYFKALLDPAALKKL